MSDFPNDSPSKFSWPMRIFIGYSVFYMVISSLIDIYKHEPWHDEFEIITRPLRLPADEEIAAINQGNHPDGYHSVSQRYAASFSSISTYFIPGLHPTFVDSDESKNQLNDPLDYLQLSAIWFQSRALFVGRLVGVDQNWPMFAPEVDTSASYPRFELRYDDGSFIVQRSVCDPPANLLQPIYSNWFLQKRRAMCTSVLNDAEVRKGYLHHLQKVYSNEEGSSQLTEIHIHKVSYDYPPPGVDEKQWYAKQSGPPEEQVTRGVFRYKYVQGEMQLIREDSDD